jgi:hypothetical protein
MMSIRCRFDDFVATVDFDDCDDSVDDDCDDTIGFDDCFVIGDTSAPWTSSPATLLFKSCLFINFVMCLAISVDVNLEHVLEWSLNSWQDILDKIILKLQ